MDLLTRRFDDEKECEVIVISLATGLVEKRKLSIKVKKNGGYWIGYTGVVRHQYLLMVLVTEVLNLEQIKKKTLKNKEAWREESSH